MNTPDANTLEREQAAAHFGVVMTRLAERLGADVSIGVMQDCDTFAVSILSGSRAFVRRRTVRSVLTTPVDELVDAIAGEWGDE